MPQILKLVATFRRPVDPQPWMARFLGGHAPLYQELPGLRRIELSSPFDTISVARGQPDRRGAPFLVSELYFDDRDAFNHAMGSAAGRAMLADLDEFATDHVSMYLADVQRDDAVG
jgi:uncharacterized protein (TIGR02118 family)